MEPFMNGEYVFKGKPQYSGAGVAQSVYLLGYGLNGRGFIPVGTSIFLFAIASRSALGPTMPLIQRTRRYFPGGKATGV